MTMRRSLATLIVAGMLGGFVAACDHIRSDGSGKDPSKDDTTKKEPVSVMPGGDRYSGSSGGGTPSP